MRQSIFLVMFFLYFHASAAEGLNAQQLKDWCNEVQTATHKLGWTRVRCNHPFWKYEKLSVEERPLVFAEIGNAKSTNTTLILSLVHGDEITPLYISLKLADWLESNMDRLSRNRVIFAPLVNPDGFFQKTKKRVNANGVDVNRNFATKDWAEKAINTWKIRYKSDPRRNPGKMAGSEPETLFQQDLIERFKPQKIISIHAPLNSMDYDGPQGLSLSAFPKEYIKRCLELRSMLKAVSSGFFPGSLGNYAGQERGIPTLTLELPSANPRYAPGYWRRFVSGIETVISFEVPNALALK